MLRSIGTAILTVLGILLVTAFLAGFGVLCFRLGVASLRGFFAYVRKQSGAQKLSTALIFGPLVSLFAFVCLGLAALCTLTLPSLLFSWLAPPELVAQANSWLEAPLVTMVMSHLATIGTGLVFSCFALGVSLACLLSIPEMVRTLHSFFDFIAVLSASPPVYNDPVAKILTQSDQPHAASSCSLWRR